MKYSKYDLVSYRLKKSRETLQEALLLAEHKRWNAAINRLYYAAYYCVLALCIKNDLKPTTHKGVKVILSSHFISTEKLPLKFGKVYGQIFALRQGGDYDDFILYTEEDISPYFAEVEWMILQIENIIDQE